MTITTYINTKAGHGRVQKETESRYFGKRGMQGYGLLLPITKEVKRRVKVLMLKLKKRTEDNGYSFNDVTRGLSIAVYCELNNTWILEVQSHKIKLNNALVAGILVWVFTNLSD